MSLIIFEENKTYQLHGDLTEPNSKKVFSYFSDELKGKSELSLNLDQVVKIDATGMGAINDLVELVIKENKSFKVSGWGREDIVEFFFLTDVA
ncbi:MAG: STAS domain-containing protein [Polaribacter sp.]